jgi:hypothetical protein
MFAGLRSAKVSDKGVWLREGKYLIRVKRGVYKQTRKKGDAFILEFQIEKSNYDEVKQKTLTAFAQANQPVPMAELEKLLPNKAGTSASWYQSLKDMDVGFGSLKGFASSILGCPSEDPAFIEAVEGFMAQVCATPGAIDGMLIPVEVITVQKGDGGDFSRHVWEKIVDETGAAAQ